MASSAAGAAPLLLRLFATVGRLILHGRYVCKARKPDCPQCIIRDLCHFRDKTPVETGSLSAQALP